MATLVTPLAVFQRSTNAGARFRLESWNPDVTVNDIEKQTGFEFDASSARPTDAITPAEQAGLDELDPDGRFATEVNA
jgi:glutaconate CoA-transferase subunit B